MINPVEEGIYESVISRALVDAVARSRFESTIGHIDPGDQPHVLGAYVAKVVQRRLASIAQPESRLQVVNDLLASLEETAEIEPPARRLLSLAESATLRRRARPRPSTPLSEAALLTNAPDEPTLASELRAEIGSADQVDLICAFVRWHGVRLLEASLSENRQREVPLRIITTTYLGSTERKALDRLTREFGAEIRVQYDAQAPGCTLKLGSFAGEAALIRPTWGHRTCRTRRCSMAWSGTCDSRRLRTLR